MKSQTKKLFESFQQITGVSFIGINNYQSTSTGEVSNYIVNVGLSVENAKRKDLEKLRNCTDADLQAIADKKGLDFNICKLALQELTASAEKNLSSNPLERSNQSQAQTDAYINITSAIRYHEGNETFHIFGQRIRKEVVVKGTYKEVKSSAKTLAKKAIKTKLNFTSDDFRDFIIDNVSQVSILGEKIDL